MKKYISGLVLAMVLVTAPALTHAQTVTPDNQALIQQLTALIIQEIKVLQAELDSLNASVASFPTQTIEAPAVVQAPVTATATATATAPEAPVYFGDESCTTSGANPTIPIVVGDIRGWTSVVTRISGVATDGTNVNQGNSFGPSASLNINWIKPGTYNYQLTFWTGSTAPFTEGTWQDARTKIFSDSGSLTVISCN